VSALSDSPGVVVGIDGSPASDEALRWAVAEATMRSVGLSLIFACPPPSTSWSARRTAVGIRQRLEGTAHDAIGHALTLVEETAPQRTSLRVSGEVIASPPLPTLIDVSKDAQMVVVGRGGTGALRDDHLGSVSSGLVRHAHCPVAVIGTRKPSAPTQQGAPVLVGIDGSEVSELATALAFGEASRRGVDLVALHTWMDIGVFLDRDVDDATLDSAEEDEVLSARLGRWQERYPEVTVHRVVAFDKAARRLVERSASTQLVVIGSHGRGGFAGMMLGSVSSAVLQAVLVPIIIARPE
jgi:nucleotide-binding universal stress UspA family protein